MRNLYKVLEQMIEKVPENRPMIREWLMHKAESVLYTAPELMIERWQEVEKFLKQIILNSKDLAGVINLGKEPGFIDDYEIELLSIWSEQDIKLIRESLRGRL